jgi:hypothetical protein
MTINSLTADTKINTSMDSRIDINELMQELTDDQAAQLHGALISTPETNTMGINPLNLPVVKPFYPALPIPKLARLKSLAQQRRNSPKDISSPLDDSPLDD